MKRRSSTHHIKSTEKKREKWNWKKRVIRKHQCKANANALFFVYLYKYIYIYIYIHLCNELGEVVVTA
jgi:hypothetical protein